MKTLLLALLFAAPRAFAQDPAEGPGDIAARVHYERAVRAEADQRWDEAAREAQATLDAAPAGKFAEASRALLGRARNHGAAAQEPSSGAGPRVELVVESTLLGLVWSSLLASEVKARDKEAVSLLMLGTGAGLGISLLASSGRQVTQSVPGFLSLGATYGAYTALLVSGFGGNDPSAGGVLAASVGGAALGLVVSPHFTGGDAAAAGEGVIYGGLVPLLVEFSLGSKPSWDGVLATLLVGSTAGLIAGPVLNRSLNFSRGRWNLIGLGGGVGGLFGLGLAILSDAGRGDGRPAAALTTVGVVGGLALTTWLTASFGVDEPRGTALLHLENGKLSAGTALSSVAPISNERGRGAAVRAFEATF